MSRLMWGILCHANRQRTISKELVHEQNFDERGFQDKESELLEEWNKASNNSFEVYCDHVRQYHARRIAYFVKNGWEDPILLEADGRTVADGLHRLKAAIHLRMENVEVKII